MMLLRLRQRLPCCRHAARIFHALSHYRHCHFAGCHQISPLFSLSPQMTLRHFADAISPLLPLFATCAAPRVMRCRDTPHAPPPRVAACLARVMTTPFCFHYCRLFSDAITIFHYRFEFFIFR
jgi:hypothetical protein